MDIDLLRANEFPWTSDGSSTYLNSASTGPMPKRSIRAANDIVTRRALPSQISDSEIFTTLASTRTGIAALVNCSPSEIALAPNTSFGINLAANLLPLGAGDVVLSFEREFPANVYPWMALRRKGVELRLIPCVDGLPDEQRLLDELDDKAVRAVAVSWVSFASGYMLNLKALGEACRSRGIFLAVDGIQGLGPAILDLAETQVDVFASGCQKWMLSPWGTGFVYVRSELINSMMPTSVGWLATKGSEDFNNLTRYALDFRDDARRFEVGTLGLQDFAAAKASLDLYAEVGAEQVARRVASLSAMLSEWCERTSGTTLLSPRDPKKRAGITTIGFSNPEEVAATLRAEGVAFSLREGAIRIATHFFNTEGEVARACGIMERVAGP